MKIRMIDGGQIKTVLNSVGRMLIEQGYAEDASGLSDPEDEMVRGHLGEVQEKNTQKQVVEVTHRHIVEEEE